jgi:hypothetical protein
MDFIKLKSTTFRCPQRAWKSVWLKSWISYDHFLCSEEAKGCGCKGCRLLRRTIRTFAGRHWRKLQHVGQNVQSRTGTPSHDQWTHSTKYDTGNFLSTSSSSGYSRITKTGSRYEDEPAHVFVSVRISRRTGTRVPVRISKATGCLYL